MQTILNAQVLEARIADAERRLNDPGRARGSSRRRARRAAVRTAFTTRHRRAAHAA